jgi:hypothetical protein
MGWTLRAATFLMLLVATTLAGQTMLPAGSAPPALEFPYFPDRVHAFVWRNWNVVPTDRLAKVLGTSEANVRDLAAAMGLPPEERVTERFLQRSYITIIRRNWHLLPYEQLLELLDWTPQHLADTLREDDFLFIKLGSVKPRCDRLTYAPPDEAAHRREAEIKQIVEAEFGAEIKKPAEPRFAFLDAFEQAVADAPPPTNAPQEGLRFIYSYFAVFGDPLSNPALDPYPDALLQQLAAQGVNGVWLHTVLRDLAPSQDFPEFGAGHEQRLANLRKLVDRASRFGIRVYLYMNEPRAMPAAFFKDRPDLAGVREGDYVALCTSSPVVRRWLSDSLEYVFKSVPNLGGVFTITASENLTNCASHGHSKDCPRCREHTPAEIITDVNAAIESGVHRGNADAKVIVWDWGWPDDQAPAVIAHLPKSCWLMSVSEWGLPLDRGGVHTTVGEYSMSAVGPGPRATKHWALAQAAGLKSVAKIQVNNTWELSAIPYLPVLNLVAQHGHNLASAQIDGLMLSWSLGGYPSENLDLIARALAHPQTSIDDLLTALATERFGPAAAPHARAAWRLFSDAFAQYPFNGAVVYTCPVQFGPANLLYAKPTHYRATMIGFPYDDLDRWRGPYPRDVFIAQFQKLSEGWQHGLAELRRAVELASPEHRLAVEGDLRLAAAAGLHFRSVVNQSRFVLARDALMKAGVSRGRREALENQIRTILRDEIAAAKELLVLTRQDSRIGFEASNQYYYLPQDLVEKVIDCRYVATFERSW